MIASVAKGRCHTKSAKHHVFFCSSCQSCSFLSSLVFPFASLFGSNRKRSLELLFSFQVYLIASSILGSLQKRIKNVIIAHPLLIEKWLSTQYLRNRRHTCSPIREPIRGAVTPIHRRVWSRSRHLVFFCW